MSLVFSETIYIFLVIGSFYPVVSSFVTYQAISQNIILFFFSWCNNECPIDQVCINVHIR